MIKSMFLVCVNKIYYKNNIFSLENPFGPDNIFYPNYLLRRNFLKKGISLDTYDYLSNKSTDYSLLFFDIPKNIDSILKKHKKIKKYLVILESEFIYPRSWDRRYHQYFEKIFTWNDSWVDNKKYFKYFLSNRIPGAVDFDLSASRKLCCMISGNKIKAGKNELYTERQNAIRWFEKHHPEEFDLYGIGWDKYPTVLEGPLFSRVVRRINFLSKALADHYPSYKGKVVSKKRYYLSTNSRSVMRMLKMSRDILRKKYLIVFLRVACLFILGPRI